MMRNSNMNRVCAMSDSKEDEDESDEDESDEDDCEMMSAPKM